MQTTILQIENKKANVRLTRPVSTESTEKFIEDLDRLYGQAAVDACLDVAGAVAVADEAVEELHIEIHSPGGSVMDGHRIYNSLLDLKSRGVRVVATINSLAASMASVIAMAADEVRIVPSGRMMIHEASTITMGTADDHFRSGEVLESMSSEIAGIYADKSGGDADDFRDLMRKETWLTATAAKDLGLVDTIIGATKPGKDDDEEIDTTETNRMSLFGNSKEVEAQISAIEANHVEYTAALLSRAEDAEARVQEAADAVVAANQIAAELEASIAAITAELTSVTADKEALEAEKAELVEAAEITAEKISVEASRMLASQGVPPVNLEADGGVPTDLWAQMAQITDPAERRKFWKANEAALKRTLKG